MGYIIADNPWKEMTAFINDSEKILEGTKMMDGAAVAEEIEKIHERYVSALQYNDENSLVSVLLIAYLSSMNRYFKPIRELPSGKGFCDVVYIPKPESRDNSPALVVELKWDKSALSAIGEIKAKHFPDSIKDYTDNILLVGINYDKTTKKHECIIEKLCTS